MNTSTAMRNEAPRDRKSVLFICGSMNQTTQMYKVAVELSDWRCCFTPYYADGTVERLRRMGLMERTLIGQRWRGQCLDFIRDHHLELDMGAANGTYDLVLTCQDLFIPRNVSRARGVLVQEGMTDPENPMFHVVKRLRFLPRWLASTSATGLSGWFEKFCVASEGFAELFRKRGVPADKLVVTGLPNFDDCARFLKNDFPHRHHVLVCTSDARETFKLHSRKRVIRNAVRIAAGRQLIFKLHPNEWFENARREIRALAPGAIIYQEGCAEHMVANCDVLVTEFSSTALVALVLGKEVHSEFPLDDLRRLLPLQNRSSAANIARVCRDLLEPGAPAERARATADSGPSARRLVGRVMDVVVIVQARTKSTRLPGKVLRPVLGKTMLERQLERILAASERFELVVATTTDPADAGIFEACRRAGVRCLAGHPSDLLERHLTVALTLGADAVVKIPSDCPLVDPGVVDRVVGRYREHDGRVDFVSNLHPATYPDGNDVEVMSFATLETAFRKADRTFEREHTTPFIWERPDSFRLDNVAWETGLDYSMTHRFTVDYPEDYEFVRAVYERLWSPRRPYFSLADILELLEKEPQIFEINARYRGVNWYRNHLHELVHVARAETRFVEEAP